MADNGYVKLECTGCGLKKTAKREPTDPPRTALIKMLCPECAQGDFSLIDYFDKDGKQLMVSASSPQHEAAVVDRKLRYSRKQLYQRTRKERGDQ